MEEFKKSFTDLHNGKFTESFANDVISLKEEMNTMQEILSEVSNFL